MKLSTLSLVSGVLLASFFVAGCTSQQTPTVEVVQQPTVEVVTTGTADSGSVAPNVEIALTKQANTETSLIKWNAKKVGGEHYGIVKLANGSLDFDAANKLVGGTFTIDMNTITVDDLEGDMQAGLLTHLQGEDFFDVANHTTSTFTITSAKEIAPNSYEITGDLTIKGITNSVTFVATVDENMTFTAPMVIDRTLWDIKFRSLKFFSDIADKAIDDMITYDITLTVQ